MKATKIKIKTITIDLKSDKDFTRAEKLHNTGNYFERYYNNFNTVVFQTKINSNN